MAYGWLGYSLMNEARSAVGLMADVRRAVPEPRPLAMIGWKEQLMLQVDRPVVHFGFRRERESELRDAAAWLASERGGVLLVAASQMAPCLDAARARPVALRHRRAWMLADAAALTGECAGAAGAGEAPRLYVPALGAAGRP
jgi:hypothetical protein